MQCASISSCKYSCPLSVVKRGPLFGGSVYISYIGLAGAKVRCPLDGGVRDLECLLKEVLLYAPILCTLDYCISSISYHTHETLPPLKSRHVVKGLQLDIYAHVQYSFLHSLCM